MSSGVPTQSLLAHLKTPTQQFARAPIGQPKQNLLPRLPRGLHHAEHPKITVPDEQALGQGIKNDPAGQDLLTEMERSQGAIQGGTTQGAEANDHAHQAPIRVLVLVAIRGELLGHASVWS